MSPSPRTPFFGFLSSLAVFSLLFAGCGTRGTTMLVPVNGGRERVRVDFTSHGPAHAEADGFEVQFAGFLPNPAPKTPDFCFTLSIHGVPPPRRITVEDITDEAPVLFFTDENPTVKNEAWRGLITGIDAHDPRTAWLYHVNDDLRIYRFTVIAADGHKVVLDQASNYPNYIKTAIRTFFGEKP